MPEIVDLALSNGLQILKDSFGIANPEEVRALYEALE